MQKPSASDAARFEAPSWPGLMPEVETSVLRALRDGQWGQYEGEYLDQLRDKLASTFQQPLVTLCSSGTIAVELALRGLGVEAGQEVILGGYDFPGNFRAIEAIGALPVLVDLPADRFALSLESIELAVTEKTAAIILSHLHGSVAPINEVMEWATTRGVSVLEDACQCPGATIDGAPAASFGDAAALSFGGSKLLTAGRGGAVLTRNERVHQRMKIVQDRGNLAFPLSQLQAAAILPQLGLLTSFHRRRELAANRFYEALAQEKEFAFPQRDDRVSPAYYKAPFWLTSKSRENFCEAAQELGIPLFPGFRGFTTRSSRRCRVPFALLNSNRFAKQTALLHHSALWLEESELVRMATTLCSLVKEIPNADSGDE